MDHHHFPKDGSCSGMNRQEILLHSVVYRRLAQFLCRTRSHLDGFSSSRPDETEVPSDKNEDPFDLDTIISQQNLGTYEAASSVKTYENVSTKERVEN